MVKNIARAVFGLVLLAVLTAPAQSRAQDPVLNQLYGSGVHQYFSGNYARAYSDLSAAINGGSSKDPRVFYFRALTAQRMGYGDGRSDLQMGASLESADVNQIYPVGKSLERVQGSTRLALERYRASARAENVQRQERRDSMRYEQRKRAEAEVLRAPVPVPPPLPSKVEVPPPPPAAAEPTDDPFAKEDDEPAAAAPKKEDAADEPAADEMPAEEADTPAEDAATDEAAADETPAEGAAEGEEMPEKEAESDPFADDPAKPE